MPADPAPPHDLLFGLIALQNGLIDQDQLLAAFGAWSRDRSRSIAERLADRGDLDPEQRAAVDRMVDLHLKKHGDVERSLSALRTGALTRLMLACLADPDLDPSHELTVGLSASPDPAAATAAWSSAGASPTSPTSSRYRILREHARGGLGQVYVALDAELNREVALKEILDGHADDISRSRFLAEGEITGNLEHPGIVPVYGLGRYADGRPYYAMRFVRGRTLKDAIAAFHADAATKADPGRRSIAFRELLGRFVAVCNAIEYAHSRGVIHRDIKPGNVIVGDHGETLVVDWGLAKVVGRPDGDHAEATVRPASSGPLGGTVAGQAVGTPAFMPPEQAEGTPDAHDRRSDVYSLGATLYAILAGRPPFAGHPARVLADVTLGKFPTPRSIDPTVDPALEAIALKAMARCPADRYEAPTALAADLTRWLADEPVTAHREPFARRARRWARRHRTGVAAAGVGLLVAVIGLAIILALESRANGLLKESNFLLTKANDRESRANTDLKLANAQAEDRYRLAQEAIKAFQTTVTDDQILKTKQFHNLRNKLLRSAAQFNDKMATLLAGKSDVSSRFSLANSIFELAKLTAEIDDQSHALGVYRRALAIQEKLVHDHPDINQFRDDLATTHHNIGVLLADAGDIAGAIKACKQALTIQERLATANPTKVQSRVEVAKSHNHIGALLTLAGDVGEALKAYRRALEIQESLAAADPDVLPYQAQVAASCNNLGVLLSSIGDSVGAIQCHRRALAIQRTLATANPTVDQHRVELASSYVNVGLMLATTGKLADALDAYHQALQLREALASANPAMAQYQADLAIVHNNTANLMNAMGDVAGALDAYRRAIKTQESLAAANPLVARYQDDLAISTINFGILLATTGEGAQALAAYRRALAILEPLAKANPTATHYQEDMATCQLNLGNLLSKIGEPDQALKAYRQSLKILDPLAVASPKVTHLKTKIAACHNSIGVILGNIGDLRNAFEECRLALDILTVLGEADPLNAQNQVALANTHSYIGELFSNSGQVPEAMESFRRALTLRRRLAESNPSAASYQVELAKIQTNIGIMLAKTGQSAEAMKTFHYALEVHETLANSNPNIVQHQKDLVNCHNNIRTLLTGTGKLAEALETCKRIVEIQKQIVSTHPGVASHLYDLAMGHINVGKYLDATADTAGALEAYRQATISFELMADADRNATNCQESLGRIYQTIALLSAKIKEHDKALHAIDRAIIIRNNLVANNPRVEEHQVNLISSYILAGDLLMQPEYDPSRALDALLQCSNAAKKLVEFKPNNNQYRATLAANYYNIACCHSRILRSKQPSSSSNKLDDRDGNGERAVQSLHRAIDAGYRSLQSIDRDHDLDPLRDRPDFRLLMMDLAMPDDPFAP